jgi:hypothetical protein
MTPTADRDLACRLAASDSDGALSVARRIPDAWFRAQALACVARYAAEPLVEGLANEALQSSRQAGDAYRVVGSAAWPIRALLERDRQKTARQALTDVLAVTGEIAPLASRAEALKLLWEAAFPGGAGLRGQILANIREHITPDGHWRAARLYRCLAATLATEDPESADRLVASMPEGPAKGRTRHDREGGIAWPPRPFFWLPSYTASERPRA